MKKITKKQKENLIPVDEFCIHHDIEITFIHSLQEFGLIEISAIKKKYFIDENQLRDLEKMIRLHADLNINSEGIDAISHLLRQLNDMQNEITLLKNKLRIYEDN
jgi:chaperone modulatory protein CbpM